MINFKVGSFSILGKAFHLMEIATFVSCESVSECLNVSRRLYRRQNRDNFAAFISTMLVDNYFIFILNCPATHFALNKRLLQYCFSGKLITSFIGCF